MAYVAFSVQAGDFSSKILALIRKLYRYSVIISSLFTKDISSGRCCISHSLCLCDLTLHCLLTFALP